MKMIQKWTILHLLKKQLKQLAIILEMNNLFKVDDIYDIDGNIGRYVFHAYLAIFARTCMHMFVGEHMYLCVSDLLVSRCVKAQVCLVRWV